MKIHCVIGMVVALASALAVPVPSAAQGARLKLDLGDLSSRAKEVVNITIDKSTIEWAMQAFNSKGGDVKKLQDLMKDLEGIYVQAVEFEQDGAPPYEELVAAARSAMQEIDGPQWTPIVSVTSKEGSDSEFVRISLFKDSAGKTNGLAVLVVEPNEVVLVNLVGSVRLDQLGILGEVLGKAGMSGLPIGGTPPKVKEEGK